MVRRGLGFVVCDSDKGFVVMGRVRVNRDKGEDD